MPPEPQIVYEDENTIVINKPAGLITHQKNLTDDQPSVVDWVIKNYPDLKDVGEPFIASGAEVPRAGIVHRLDKDTSGLLLIAKTNDAFYFYKNLFQTKKIHKYYLALVHGTPKNQKGTISSPLGRIGLKRTTKVEGKKLIDTKEAETNYETLKKYKKFSLMQLSPKTGRTHQLRVHMNSIGHPIAGDRVYRFKKLPEPHLLKRLFLHAFKLNFINPNGQAMTIEADLPEDLSHLLTTLE